MKALFFLVTIFLPVDGWPSGASILREFGVRPSNFFLLFTLIVIFLKKYKNNEMHLKLYFSHYRNLFYIFIFLLIFNISILLINFLLGTIDDIRFTKGILQSLLTVWLFVSIYIWSYFFKNINIESSGYPFFIKCVMFCALVNLMIFASDFYNRNFSEMSIIDNFLLFFRGEHDIRVSGLSSEPSSYASWALLFWPLLVFTKKKSINLFFKALSILIGAACLISGFMCESRTFLLIFIFQIVLLIVLLSQKKGGWLGVSALFIMSSFILIMFFSKEIQPIFERLGSIFNVQGNYSSMTRLGTASAALDMLIDNWITGVGIGQFTYSYSQYIPDWALSSPEVQAYISGDTNYRINAFNLFLRIGSELGLIAFILSIWFVLSILKKGYLLFKNSKNESLWWAGILLSSLGGISFWMQQDLFSYQPGIFSIGLILYLSHNQSARS